MNTLIYEIIAAAGTIRRKLRALTAKFSTVAEKSPLTIQSASILELMSRPCQASVPVSSNKCKPAAVSNATCSR